MDERNPVSVYTGKSVAECDVVRMVLAGEGIATFVAQQKLSALTGFGLFNLYVMVDVDDAERAKACIEDHRCSPVSAEEFEGATPDSPSTEDAPEDSEERGFPLLRWFRLAFFRPTRKRQWWERFFLMDNRRR